MFRVGARQTDLGIYVIGAKHAISSIMHHHPYEPNISEVYSMSP